MRLVGRLTIGKQLSVYIPPATAPNVVFHEIPDALEEAHNVRSVCARQVCSVTSCYIRKTNRTGTRQTLDQGPGPHHPRLHRILASSDLLEADAGALTTERSLACARGYSPLQPFSANLRTSLGKASGEFVDAYALPCVLDPIAHGESPAVADGRTLSSACPQFFH